MPASPLPVVFLCGHRKSGTSMFRDLFDGHPQACTYPGDICLYYGYYPIWARGDHDRAERLARLERVAFGELQAALDADDLGDACDVPALARAFFAGLDDPELTDTHALVSRLLDTYRRVAEPGSAARVCVAKETSIEIYADEILASFPGSRMIQILRDPRDNYAALRAGLNTYYSGFGDDHVSMLCSLIHRLGTSLRLREHLEARHGPDRFLALRFEDLVRDPEFVMRKVADFVGVDFRFELLHPTKRGRNVRGNSHDRTAMPEISARNVGRWRERISDDETRVIEFYLGEPMEAHGYRRAFAPADCLAAVAEFYKLSNHRYFFFDRFASAGRPT